MKRCPECKQFFGDEIQHCPNDGTALVDRLPGKDPFMGRILAGRYEVLDLIGKGGFGVVFKVRDRKMEDVVALKVFDRRRFTDTEAQEAIKRFRREGVLLRRTGKRSNNIVTVYDFEEDEAEELFYFTMDYVEGTTLATILTQEGPLEIPRVLELGRQVCSALNAAHFEGVVHRDLKLENLMVVQEAGQETVKVLDFGIAKVVGSQSLTNLAVGVPGTPGYAPPEQLQSPDKIDGRTDLFALGVVLYGLITGREPWQGSPITDPPSSDKVWDLIRNSLEGDPTPIRRWNPDVPKGLEAAILKLLAKEQDDRFQSADELDKELARIQDHLEAQRPKDPGSVTVHTESDGVRVALRRGFRVVAQGTTPWTARSLRPGEYLVEIKDKRFHKETRRIVVEEAEEAAVHLSATERPPRASLGEIVSSFFKRFRTPLLAAGGVVVLVGVVLAIRPYLPGPRVALTPQEFQEALDAGTVLRARIEEDRLDGVRRTADGEEGRFRVNLAGTRVQSLADQLRALDVPLETSGEGSLRVVALDQESGQPASGSSLSLRKGGAGCSPCGLNEELELEGGWYDVERGGQEWVPASLTVQDRSGIFQEETLDQEGASLFLPPGASLELVSSVAPTPVRVAAAQVNDARSRGELKTAADRLAEARGNFPEHPWIAALEDSLATDIAGGARGIVAAGNPSNAGEWVDLCAARDLQGGGCGQLQEWLDVREEAGAALDAEEWASATELAEECLRLSPQDPDCQGVRREAAQALAAEQATEAQQESPPPDPDPDPVEETPPPTRDDPPVQRPAETPEVERLPPALVQALREARSAMDRDELRPALAAVLRALEVAPDHEPALNLRAAILTRSRNRALAAFRSIDPQGAQNWAPLCLEIDPSAVECSEVVDWLDAKRTARQAAQAQNHQETLQAAQECLRLNPGDGACGRMVEAAQTAIRGAEAEREAENQPSEPAPPALAASELTVRSFDFSDGQFRLQGRFSAVGPGDTPLCVASIYSDAGQGPLRDTDGQFNLGGLVAVTGPTPRPGPSPETIPIGHTLPANQLDRPRGQVRVIANVRIWAGACGSVDPSSTPLAQTSSQPICVFRFPGGWNLCREDDRDR